MNDDSGPKTMKSWTISIQKLIIEKSILQIFLHNFIYNFFYYDRVEHDTVLSEAVE